MNVYFHTFGCKANQCDTELVRQAFTDQGAVVVDDPGAADLTVVNSCTVTHESEVKLRRFVRRVARTSSAETIVMGCAAALDDGAIAALPSVRAVVANADPLMVLRAAGLSSPPDPLSSSRRGGTNGHHRGLLKIQDGCDEHCTFCATTLARGANRSRSVADIVEEAKALGEHHAEIVLTGVHIGTYGQDGGMGLTDPGRKPGVDQDPRASGLGPGANPDPRASGFGVPPDPRASGLGVPRACARGQVTLGSLLESLIAAVPQTRFRLSSVEATEVDDRLARLLIEAPRQLAAHLHAPLQSGSSRVLKRMGRHWYTAESYRARIAWLAERLPVFGLGADVIAGFPGETADDHRATVELVNALPFTYLHVFPFSMRPDAAAARLADQVSPVVIDARARELRELGEAKAVAHRARRRGTQADGVVSGRLGGRVDVLTEDYLSIYLPSDRWDGRPRLAITVD